MGMTALLLALAAFAMGVFDLFVGRNLFNRPLLTATIVGLLLGDVQAGMAIGATLELAFIGLFAIGAAIPPEILSGGILATAFAISAGQGAETALVLAFPIAAVGLIIKNMHFFFISPLFLHRADTYAKKGSFRGVSLMHIGAGLLQMLLLAALIGISFAVGSQTMSTFLAAIPEKVVIGLRVATLILPALGFALLGRMLINKRVMPYFFLGFLLVAYLKLDVVAIAAIGTIIAWIMVALDSRYTPNQPALATAAAQEIDDDF